MSTYPTDLSHVAIYLRKSRADMEAEARGEGETLLRHRAALTELGTRYRYAITGIFEEIVSGERIWDRPQMQQLLDVVRQGHYDAVLCMDIDRLGRGNMMDQGFIQDTFKRSNTLIITPRKVYDLQDELDEDWSEFEAFMARRELKMITRRMQRGRRQSASEGKSISKKPPYGYTRRRDLKLEIDPRTGPIVELIYSMAASGMGITAIANHLTELGVPTPSGRSVWERSSVYAILKNPVYQGHIVWGRFHYEKNSGQGSKYRRVPQRPEHWVTHEHAHPALVTPDVYERYLHQLADRPKVSAQRQLVNPLAGLIYCKQCGRSMRRQQTYNRPHNILLCPTHQCPTKGARFEVVEARMLQGLKQVLEGMEINPSDYAEVITETIPPSLDIEQSALKHLQYQQAELRLQRNNLYTLLERNVYDVVTFTTRSEHIAGRLMRIETQIADLSASIRHRRQHKPNTPIPSQPIPLMDWYERASTPQLKNEFLRSLIKKITYRREPHWLHPDQFELDIVLRF